MKTLFSTLFILLLAIAVRAQEVKVPTDVQKSVDQTNDQLSGKTSLGGLISQLADNLKDEALSGDLRQNKMQFSQSVTNTSDAGGLASALQKLQDAITPSAMDATWGAVKEKWITDSNTAGTAEDVATLLQQLESHIQPSFFKSQWSTIKPAWDSALNTMVK